LFLSERQMADKKNMSIEEILAACRHDDGDGASADDTTSAGGDTASASAGVSDAVEEQVEPQVDDSAADDVPATSPAKPAAARGDPSKMSVADMLAAARAEKSGTSAPKEASPSRPQASSAEVATSPANKPPASKPAAKIDPGKMSVADMLAAARAEKTGAKPDATADNAAAAGNAAASAKPAGPKAVPPKAAAKKPAAAQPAAAMGKAKPATASAAEPKDTASILLAARKGAKPGPMSKFEAAAKGETAPPEKKKPAAPPLPERPAYARPAPSAPEVAERRNFLATLTAAFFGSSLAVGFTTLAVTHLLWLLGLARFMFPNILIEPPTKFKVGFPDDLAPGQVETKYKAQFGVWIVRYEYNGQPEIYAIQSVCTHLGCTPNWLEGEQKFKCPCHGSGFYKDGINFEGPAPRPLERFAIRLADDGQLEVDKSRKFQEELGQWEDPASFVSV
jgi:cytochrome b6-f complex iron-sulfur subunit